MPASRQRQVLPQASAESCTHLIDAAVVVGEREEGTLQRAPRCCLPPPMMLMATVGMLNIAAAAALQTERRLSQFAFSNTLGDHAVLQSPVTVWGTGAPGSTVTTIVSGGASPFPPLSTTVGSNGIWRQALSLADSLSPVTISSTSRGTTIELKDILVGKVILCSGQSNIDTIVTKNAFNASAEIAAAGGFPHIRIMNTAHTQAWGGPLLDLPPVKQPWAAPSPINIPGFSATCWFAARDLFLELGGTSAVGVVQSAAGGTAVRNWVPTSGLAHCSQPWSGLQHYGYNPYTQSTLFNGMIHPFGTGPTSFTFVLWDQAVSADHPPTQSLCALSRLSSLSSHSAE
jgi:hypothetical protein